MNKELKSAIENSPVWKRLTDGLNRIVDKANELGEIIPDEGRELLSKHRLYSTLMDDEKVRNLYAEYVYEKINS